MFLKAWVCFLIIILFSEKIYSRCDTSVPPVIFIHGFLAGGDTWAHPVRKFSEAGFCAERFFVYDWNSLAGTSKDQQRLLKEFIDQVLLRTSSKQVVLVGHSAGGALARNYLSSEENSKNVSHYIHIGSRRWENEFSWFPNSRCMNIYSDADQIAGKGAGEIPGAVNINLITKDHYEVATSDETWNAILQFLKLKIPPDRHKEPNSEKPLIGGKAVMLGENIPVRGAIIKVWNVDSKTGRRKKKKPENIFVTDSLGQWGPFETNRSDNYELEFIPSDTGQRTISYFIGKVKYTNTLLYLRGFPKSNMMNMMLKQIPSRRNESAILIYSSRKAIIAGRDTLKVNDIPVSTFELTPSGRNIISFFIFDDGDGISSGKTIKSFGNFPFITAADIHLPAKKKAVHRIYFNGEIRNIPALPSSERIFLAVF
ncbi:MAG: alpha/beta fold hydrolase [Chitinophagaceae bacterium]|nr:alpha/beta fold hydrolase [Chitinophagaceae bacterium]